MADQWDAFPDAPAGTMVSTAGADPWSEFPDAPAAKPRAPDTRYESFGPLAPAARYVEDMGNFAGDPIGLRDEVAAIGAAVREFATGTEARKAGKPSILESAGDEYNKRKAEVNALRDQAREDYPVASRVSEYLLGPLGTAKAATGFKAAQTLGPRVWQSAKAGAGFGAAAGAARAEGGVGNRVEGAIEGGLTGAALGPIATEVVAPVVGAVAGKTLQTGKSLANAVRSVRSRAANVDARYARALEQQNMTPQQALQRLDEVDAASKFGKTQRDTQFTPADLGPSTRDLVDTAALVSKEARGEAGTFLRERARDQFGRVNDYLRRSMQVTRGDFAKTQASLIDEQQRLSKTAYDAFRSSDVRIPVGDVLYNAQIEDLAAAPALKATLQKAREQFVSDRIERTVDGQKVSQAYTDLTPARFDAGKRALDDMIDAAQRSGHNNEARLLTKLKKDLVGVADKATSVPVLDKAGNPVLDAKGNPAMRSLYGEARDVYGSRAEMLDGLEAGRAFMRGDAEMTGAQYRALSTAEKRMFRIGVAREVRKSLGAKGLNSDMIGYFDKPNTRDVLEEIMTKGQAKRFYDLIEVEQALGATNNAVRGNSKTAQRQQDVLDFSLGVRLGRAIKTQGLREALSNEIFDQITKFFAMREQDAVTLTRMMLQTDRAAQRADLQRLVSTYGKTNMRGVIDRANRIAQLALRNRQRSLAGVAGERGQDAYEGFKAQE